MDQTIQQASIGMLRGMPRLARLQQGQQVTEVGAAGKELLEPSEVKAVSYKVLVHRTQEGVMTQVLHYPTVRYFFVRAGVHG
jgi:hypothetical protein